MNFIYIKELATQASLSLTNGTIAYSMSLFPLFKNFDKM
jgi:hypothetical protein